jgi:hypothetical protein
MPRSSKGGTRTGSPCQGGSCGRDSRIPCGGTSGRRAPIEPGRLDIVAIGPKRTLPVDTWRGACDAAGGKDAVVALFLAEGHLPVCHPLDELMEHLLDQHRANEPLDDGKGNALTPYQFKVLVDAARKHLPGFDERFMKSEVKRVANIVVKPQLLQHQCTMSRLKQQFRAREIDKATMQREQKESANAFDVRYTAVQARAEEVYRSLGPMQSLTVRKVAKSKEEHDEAMKLVALS